MKRFIAIRIGKFRSLYELLKNKTVFELMYYNNCQEKVLQVLLLEMIMTINMVKICAYMISYVSNEPLYAKTIN